MARSRKRHQKDTLARYKARARAQRYTECTECPKRLYRTQNDALDAIGVARGAGGGRAYEAHGGWHITSRRSRT